MLSAHVFEVPGLARCRFGDSGTEEVPKIYNSGGYNQVVLCVQGYIYRILGHCSGLGFEADCRNIAGHGGIGQGIG
jgi:hypothetical protein